MRIGWIIFAGCFLIFVIWYSISIQPASELRILSAGSLKLSLEEIAAEFQELHPGLEIKIESSGSIAAIRKYMELNKSADLIAVSDYRLIPRFMKAPWYMGFASNQMVLSYTPRSKYSSLINSSNWLEIISRSDVKLGISDPNQDPCGYRGLMVLMLGAKFYNNSKILDLLESWMNINIEIRDSEIHAFVPSDLNPLDPKLVMRPKEIDLVGLLEAGTLDYALEYRSVAVEHGLNFIELPPQINLGDPEHSEEYSKAVVHLKMGGENPIQAIQASPIIYGITLTQHSPNPGAGIDFLKFLLTNGTRILSKHGFQPISPIGEIPPDLR